MRHIYVFCEGDTEYNYVQKLNRVLRENDCQDLSFTTVNMNGGLTASGYVSKIKSEIRKKQSKDYKNFQEIYIWLDYDIFKRANIAVDEVKKEISSLKAGSKNLIVILNYMNGEDFMVLNYPKVKVLEWNQKCIGKNHFENPMDSVSCIEEFNKVLPDYQKGHFPMDIAFTKETLKMCLQNMELSDVEIKSDAKTLLEIVLTKIA
ncbi:RloB domain-containing protein [bacterium]|nr:RloB domain-containing protein [bacterium]NCQ55929.1 RloB domain-containing protein [Candidatus Parcubacteria bacterium]NCS67954.1 RloB domain-containing protein [Candidatus Peregrinibacteria bacterium]NCS96848.1 RloB domain-containing protein [bacterium]